MKFDYDLIIIGSGPAGFSAAMQATKLEKKVLLVEADSKNLGGSWINTGTVPSKALREAASIINKHTSLFGEIDGLKSWEKFKMTDLLKYKDMVVDHENSELKRNLIKNEIDTARGFGKLKDEHTVEVTDHLGNIKQYTTHYILIATGSSQLEPKTFKVDDRVIIDSYSIAKMTHIPRRVSIVGAGVSAIEFATIFASLGSKVTILNPDNTYLSFLDDEIKNEFDRALEKYRIVMFKNVKIQGIEKNTLRNRTEIRFKVSEEEQLRVIETEHVIYFGGRKPNTQGLGLEAVGVTLNDDGYIIADENYKTVIDNIYAAGDAIGFPQLASASFTQGRVATCHLSGISDITPGGSHPFGIYSIPEISSVGLNEFEAKEAGYEITVGRAYYRELTKSTVSNDTLGMMKIIVDNKTLHLLGVHVVGEAACELVHIGQVLIKKKIDVRYFIDNILNYPTYSEAYRIATFNAINRMNKAGTKYRSILQEKQAAQETT